jgi:hypothetical protein
MKIAECTAITDGPGEDLGVPAATGRHYLYAIVAGDEAHTYPSLGLDGKDVYTISDGRVAAVVSRLNSSKIRPERANLKAHQAVLDGLRHDRQ